MERCPVGEDGAPRVLLNVDFILDSLDDLVELELGELVVDLAVGMVNPEELLGLLQTALLD